MENTNEYPNGWTGFTKSDWIKMYDTNTAQYPDWISVSNGLGFDAAATLRTNGIDPNAVPAVFRERRVVSVMLDKINESLPLTYVDIPDGEPYTPKWT